MSGVLVHEWIAQAGGSENVLQAMSETFTDNNVLCSWNERILKAHSFVVYANCAEMDLSALTTEGR